MKLRDEYEGKMKITIGLPFDEGLFNDNLKEDFPDYSPQYDERVFGAVEEAIYDVLGEYFGDGVPAMYHADGMTYYELYATESAIGNFLETIATDIESVDSYNDYFGVSSSDRYFGINISNRNGALTDLFGNDIYDNTHLFYDDDTDNTVAWVAIETYLDFMDFEIPETEEIALFLEQYK